MSDAPKELAAQHFARDMLDGCFVLKKLGYWPSYFHREVANIGGVQTVRNLLAKQGTSEGFSTLWSLDRLDLTAEAYVLMPWYQALFSDDERTTARQRLDSHNFDVDGWLTTLTPPSWSLVSD